VPRPLSALTPDEQRLYTAQGADPLAADRQQILADTAEEQGQEQRAALLRQTRLSLLELLRGQALTEQESAQVAVRIHALLTSPALGQQATAMERELSSALGGPQRGNDMLELLDPEGNLDIARLPEQYDFQVTLLASLDLLEYQSGHLGITGIDHHFHPLPPLSEIQRRLQTPALYQKVAQGFNLLVLVPFALPLKRLLDAWRQDLLRNEHLLQLHGGLNREESLWAWEEGFGLREGQGPDEDGRLIYTPQRFEADHGGHTKGQLLASKADGWQVLLTEGSLTNLPLAGQVQLIADRRQIEAGRTPREYLESLPQTEVGWTPETYIVAFLTHLERTGQPLDTETLTYLIGSYAPTSGLVPYADWNPWRRQAYLDGYHPGIDFPGSGGRVTVGVL